MSDTIHTAEELDALPDDSVIRDSMGDVGVLHGPRVWYPETAPLTREYVGRHYLPATVLYRPDRPSDSTLSDAALIEEVAHRGMTVMDAAEAARLRGEVDPATDDTPCPTCGCPTRCPEGLAEALDTLRSGIAELADGYEQAGRDAEADGDLAEADFWFKHATKVRALLSAADEAGA